MHKSRFKVNLGSVVLDFGRPDSGNDAVNGVRRMYLEYLLEHGADFKSVLSDAGIPKKAYFVWVHYPSTKDILWGRHLGNYCGLTVLEERQNMIFINAERVMDDPNEGEYMIKYGILPNLLLHELVHHVVGKDEERANQLTDELFNRLLELMGKR